MTDIERGRKALNEYYQAMKGLYPKRYNVSLDQFMVMIKRAKTGSAIEDGLGGAIRETALNESQVRSAMWSLANMGGGKIPANALDFIYGLNGQATKINFVDAVAYTVVESAATVAGGIQAGGDSIITTLKVANGLFPILVIGGGLFFLVSWLNKTTGGDIEKVIKALRK